MIFSKLMSGVLTKQCNLEQRGGAAAFVPLLEARKLHVDNYHACGGREQLEELQSNIGQQAVVKEWATHGPDDLEEYEHLQRRWLTKHEGT